MHKTGGIWAGDEKRRKRRALLLALATSALLSLIFILLIWSPTPPTPEATGYLLLELGEGSPVLGEEVPPVPMLPELEQPPAPPPQPQPVEKPSAPEPAVAAKPQPLAEPEPQPELQPEAPQPQGQPEPPQQQAQPTPSPLAGEAEPVVEPPLPEAQPEPEAAPQVPTQAVEEPAPQETTPLQPGTQPPEIEPEPEPVAPTQAAEEPPVEPQPIISQPPATVEPQTVNPTQPQETPIVPQPGPTTQPAPAVPEPAAQTTQAEQPAFQPSLPQQAVRPAPPTPAPPAPAPPAFAPAPPAPSPPLAGGEPATTPPTPTASPQIGQQHGAAIGPGEKPYKLRRLRPLLVSIDNANAAFPQWGLEWAVQIHEVPVEGGVTRLLVRFEGGERGRIGPIRSARPYIIDLARSMGAVLLHVGGSPAALAKIEKEGVTTFDGLYDPLFKRESSKRPPHNTFVNGPEVRKQLKRLRLENSRLLSGKAYRPAENAAPGERLEVRYAPDYASAFRYNGKGYTWYRNGSQTRVGVAAVVVLRIQARVIDDVGRLQLALTRGDGTLYLEGKRVPIKWRFDGALVLTDEAGNLVDITPYKTWFLWTPPWARIF